MSKNRLKDRSAASSRDGVAQAGRVDPLQDVLTSLNLRLTVSDLKAALEAMRRENSAADLPARDRNFWAAHSGINTDPTPRRARFCEERRGTAPNGFLFIDHGRGR